MPAAPDTCNQLMEEFRAYLETLTFIQIDPRLHSEFSMSTSSRTPCWRRGATPSGSKRWTPTAANAGCARC